MTDNILMPQEATEPFKATLARHGVELTRDVTTTLQINVGLLCNQKCRHCHLDAGPQRREIMDKKTACQVVELAARHRFKTIDITGGAPELNPHIETLLNGLTPLTDKVIFRSNLTAINNAERLRLIDICRKNRAAIVASFPSINENQAESQRGAGVFNTSLETLRTLNSKGYGQNESGLELNLVSNPTGAFLPAGQAETEKRFRQTLDRKWGITFNRLFTFANVPLGRFRAWLEQTGNLDNYQQKLAQGFNPCAIDSLMCRSLISVSWDGYLFDCDFNQAVRLHIGGRKTHISELTSPPAPGVEIAVADHCYTCTAGAGFT